jgi:hypothetical protein
MNKKLKSYLDNEMQPNSHHFLLSCRNYAFVVGEAVFASDVAYVDKLTNYIQTYNDEAIDQEDETYVQNVQQCIRLLDVMTSVTWPTPMTTDVLIFTSIKLAIAVCKAVLEGEKLICDHHHDGQSDDNLVSLGNVQYILDGWCPLTPQAPLIVKMYKATMQLVINLRDLLQIRVPGASRNYNCQ